MYLTAHICAGELKKLKRQYGKQGVAGSIPSGGIFILNFSLGSRHSQLGGTFANEIKHDHVVHVF